MSRNKLLDIVGASFLTAGVLGSGCSSKFNTPEYLKNFEFKESTDQKNRYRVYAFGGFGGNILEGIAASAGNEFSSMPILVDHGSWPQYMQDINYDASLGYSLIFASHSLGCKDALKVAHILKDEEVPIYLMFFDAGHMRNPFLAIGGETKIPDNVKGVLNFYSSGWFKGRGIGEKDFENPRDPDVRVLNFHFDIGHNDFSEHFYLDRYMSELKRILPRKD